MDANELLRPIQHLAVAAPPADGVAELAAFTLRAIAVVGAVGALAVVALVALAIASIVAPILGLVLLWGLWRFDRRRARAADRFRGLRLVQ